MRFSRLITFAAATMTTAMLVVVPAAGAADQYFLKIDTVVGEAKTGTTPNVVELESFELGAETQAKLGAGSGVSRAQLGELTVTKNVDSTTPVLFTKLAQSTAIPGMELVVRHNNGAGGAPIYMRYVFQPVILTSQTQSAGSGDSNVSEKLVFTYGSLKQSFVKASASGVPNPANVVSASWNQITNTATMLVPGFADTSNIIRIAS